MRTTEERVAAVKRRIRESEARRSRRRRYALAAVSTAASLVFLVILSVFMTEIVKSAEPGGYAGFGMTASIFSGNSVYGYMIIGFIAFGLGVCVTLLCLCLRRLDENGREDGDGQEDADD